MASIASGPGGFVVRFRPDAGMRKGNTDAIRSEPLHEVAVDFAPSLAATDLSSCLRALADGVCRFEERK